MDNGTVHLLWKGMETVNKVKSSLIQHRYQKIEIELAEDYNHTLFTKLHPNSTADEFEQIDIEGDAGLIRKIAEIKGLTDFSNLSDSVSSAHALVRVITPPMVIIQLPLS